MACLGTDAKRQWAGVTPASVAGLPALFESVLRHAHEGSAEGSAAVRAQVELYSACDGAGPGPLGPSAQGELRALLEAPADDVRLLPFLSAVARDASQGAADGVAQDRVELAAGSRAAVGDATYLKLLCALAAGCVRGGTRGAAAEGAACERVVGLVVSELARRSSTSDGGGVDLRVLTGAAGLEACAAAWLAGALEARQRPKGPRSASRPHRGPL